LGRIIAIANQKGGVGKTTTAINLAASLAAAEKRVLAIDSDPQGNLTSGLGLRTTSPRPGLYEVLLGECEMADAIVPTNLDRLKIVPADRNLTGAEIELVTVERREYRLADALAPIVQDFDYLLIDSPPSLGLLTVNALAAAATVLIPLQCEFFALEGISELTNTMQRVRGALNSKLALEGVLLTMVDQRTNLSQQVAREIHEHFADRVFKTRVPRSIRLGEAPSFGQPILLYDIRSTGAQAYLSLAQEIMANEEKGTGQGAVSLASGT